MLLRFCFTNHRSFRDEICLSLVPAKLKESNEFNLQIEGTKYSALPACILYGANASGKSNVIDALKYICHVVRNSHARWDPADGVDRAPFKLDQDSASRASEFVVDFTVDGVLYQFGFSADDVQITSEWLFCYPRGSRQLWYERENQSFKFGKYLKGNISIIRDITRKNSLFLSAAAQNNNEQLALISDFFRNIRFAGEIFSPGNRIQVSAESIGKIVEFMRIADLGIVDACLEKEDVPKEVKELFESIQTVIDQKEKDKKEKRTVMNISDFETISFAHKATGKESVFLNLSEESDGTVRLANLLAPILRVLETGGVLAIDELDASLHPILSARIFEIFNSPELNINGAQLIAATHDTNLLCHDAVRRDQIWFVEKDEGGCSEIYPLIEFSTRRTDNLEKGYLEGRYGAIPFLGSVKGIRAKIAGD